MIIKFIFKMRLRDFGLKLKIKRQYYLIYLGMFLIVQPVIIYASTREDFRAIYPFFRGAFNAPVSDIIICEIAYLSTFIALEFFFRGFLVHGTKRRFGAYAIFAMAFPYCMIHFGKPMPETLGAIVAGIVLGFMSLKTGSVGMGAALHIAIAWTMDGLAIWRAG